MNDSAFFVSAARSLCNEIGFVVTMTPYQPLAWLVSEGLNDTFSGSASPPFFGTGELKCVVVAPRPEVAFHNTIQGRATAFDSSGATVSYDAVGFQRLSDGDYTGVVSLDGANYAQCPDKLHFEVFADQPDASPPALSDLVLVPCSEDLLLQDCQADKAIFLNASFRSARQAAHLAHVNEGHGPSRDLRGSRSAGRAGASGPAKCSAVIPP